MVRSFDMDQKLIQSIVEEVVNQISMPQPKKTVPISVSARHCHLSKEDLELLFGEGYELTKKADLSQPGQFAANETVAIIGPKGTIRNVRILGPTRSHTQVEVSKTDAIALGLNPPLRESGDIKGSAPITILGPKGSIYKKEGLIIAKAHIHMSPEDAKEYNVKDGEFVKVVTDTERPVTFENVLIRVSDKFRLDMHIDTDEANAGFITTGTTGKLIKYTGLTS